MAGALLTDLYQLTMAHAYLEEGMQETAVFELFVRRLPPTRRFLIAAGLEQALEFIGELRFTAPELEFLARDGSFTPRFLDYLSNLRFSGSVHAMPEGTPFFAEEPILRITAPIIEAQLLESRLINIVHFQTLIASKAARCVIAAQGRRLVDFGMRRAHEGDAALFSSRAAYLAGFDATATVEAGRLWGIPISGTVAHSYIEAHDDESQAFRQFTATRPARTTLLIDTYDTMRAAEQVARLESELKAQGSNQGVDSVRIDSGDLGAQAREVRRILDEHGCREVQIALSGGVDEHQIAALVSSGVPVDAFGVGTALAVSADAPALDMAYKLQMYAGRPRRKRSPGKATWPGAKQVLREYGRDGLALRDRIVLEGETTGSTGGVPLLTEVMRGGRVLLPPRPLQVIRNDCAQQLRALPRYSLELDGSPEDGASCIYPVIRSEAVEALAASAG
ncbi:MAG TPA: nicotinate phosphoribosyltransferase [Steroidobacteraceae bacterium]|jgi:nicotinate phosphoribosyltransferase|nr:nicotinate phosphoribosyltransferase [Steroidobacteraceae bacterium]